MAARNATAELAEKLVQTLQNQRYLGEDAYPLMPDRLAQLAAPEAAPDLVKKALRHKTFTGRTVRAKKTGADSPVALSEDAARLAESSLVLEFTLRAACNQKTRTATVAKLKVKVVPELRPAFAESVARRLRENDFPEGVGALFPDGEPALYLTALPPPAPLVLASEMLRELRARRNRGGDAYPATPRQLADAAQPDADTALVRQATGQKVFKGQTVQLQGKAVAALVASLEAPVVLKGDEARLAGSPLLLQSLLGALRTDVNQALPLKDLKKKLGKSLQNDFEEGVKERLSAGALPDGIGALRIKKDVYLFLTRDLLAGAVPSPVPEPPVPPPPPLPPMRPFADSFAEAFDRLDRDGGWVNFVSLVDLRRALPYDRAAFDAGLRDLRRAGRFTLSAAEGRHGISPEERDAGIYEDGTLLLYVAKRRRE